MWSSIQKGQGQGQGYRGIEQVVRFLVPVMVDICVWGGGIQISQYLNIAQSVGGR